MPDSGTIDDVPFVAFSNAELDAAPRVEAGDAIVCAHCGETHVLEDSATPPGLLLFFSCGGKTYLGAVRGALVFGHTAATTREEEADGL